MSQGISKNLSIFIALMEIKNHNLNHDRNDMTSAREMTVEIKRNKILRSGKEFHKNLEVEGGHKCVP